MSDYEFDPEAKQNDNVIRVHFEDYEGHKSNPERDLESTGSENKKYNFSVISSRNNPVSEMVTLFKDDDTMSDNRDDKYNELKEDMRESERRVSQDIRDREERFENTMEKFANDAKEREERYMKMAEEIKQVVYDGEKSKKSASIAMWTLAISTILGIAAMVVTVLVSV